MCSPADRLVRQSRTSCGCTTLAARDERNCRSPASVSGRYFFRRLAVPRTKKWPHVPTSKALVLKNRGNTEDTTKKADEILIPQAYNTQKIGRDLRCGSRRRPSNRRRTGSISPPRQPDPSAASSGPAVIRRDSTRTSRCPLHDGGSVLVPGSAFVGLSVPHSGDNLCPRPRASSYGQ